MVPFFVLPSSFLFLPHRYKCYSSFIFFWLNGGTDFLKIFMALTYGFSSFSSSSVLMHFKLVHFASPTSINLFLLLIIQASDSVSTIMLTFENTQWFFFFASDSYIHQWNLVGYLNHFWALKMIIHQNISDCFYVLSYLHYNFFCNLN